MAKRTEDLNEMPVPATVPFPKMLTLDEVQETLNLCKPLVYGLVKSGELRAAQFGGGVFGASAMSTSPRTWTVRIGTPRTVSLQGRSRRWMTPSKTDKTHARARMAASLMAGQTEAWGW